MPIIEVQNLSKKYKIHHQKGGYVTLRDILSNVIKHPFRFLKHRAKKVLGLSTDEEFWALKNINFTVEKGEAIGIIGPNGAGKSTLLKILSKITPPTEGSIVMKGKAASLLEVGTGFHPELTGRENIFLNGAILGMTRKEMREKFDAIVEFSGVEKFLDTPVKHYSSGMYVRLAFSVAAHLDPDILIVDEVLAVGDAEFQKKCLGKMDEVTKKEGRTVLFVSHNLSAVRNLCKRTILLEHGTVKMIGPTDAVISKYLAEGTSEKISFSFERKPSLPAQILDIELSDRNGEKTLSLPTSEEWNINIKYAVNNPDLKLVVGINFYSSEGVMFYQTSDCDSVQKMTERKPGIYEAKISIPKNFLVPGLYFLRVIMFSPGVEVYDLVENIKVKITEDKDDIRASLSGGKYAGYIGSIIDWQIKDLLNE